MAICTSLDSRVPAMAGIFNVIEIPHFSFISNAECRMQNAKNAVFPPEMILNSVGKARSIMLHFAF
jgi:hypothetical protein